MNINKYKLQQLIKDVPEAPPVKRYNKDTIANYFSTALGVYIGYVIAKRVIKIKL